MFEDGNRIRFIRPVDQTGRDWWIERFYEPFDLTPEAMGDLLTSSAGGDRTIKYEFIDGIGQAFRLRVEGGLSGPGEVWFVERTFELRGNFFNADEMFVSANGRGKGLGRKLMRDLIEASRRLNVDRIKIQTRDLGRYVWLKMGFRPDAGSWNDMRKSMIDAVLRFQSDLGTQTAFEIVDTLAKGSPETANIMAALPHLVPSRQLFDAHGQPVRVPLGKALLLEWAGDWAGEFVLADPEMPRIAKNYVEEADRD